MKLSLVVLLLALFATALAKPNRKSKRDEVGKGEEYSEKKMKEIEHEIDQEILIGEQLAGNLAGEEHKGEGDISICALELLGDLGHSLEKAFEEKGDKHHEKKGELAGEMGMDFVKRMFRLKRSAQEPSPSPSSHPSFHPSEGGKPCNGALEKFFQCMRDSMGELEGEHGTEHGEHEELHEGTTEASPLKKRKSIPRRHAKHF